jgi:hypothetical protein
MKKKFVISLAILVTLLGFGLSACTATPEETIEYCDGNTIEGYEEYTDEDNNFKFQYPEKWTLNKDTNDVYLTVLSELDSDEDLFQEGMNLIIEDLTEEESKGDLTEAVEAAIDELEKEMEEFDLASNEDLSLSGLEAKEIKYTWVTNEIKVEMRQVIAISRSRQKQYVITFSNFEEDDNKGKWDEIYDKMIDSFCFTEEE